MAEAGAQGGHHKRNVTAGPPGECRGVTRPQACRARYRARHPDQNLAAGAPVAHETPIEMQKLGLEIAAVTAATGLAGWVNLPMPLHGDAALYQLGAKAMADGGVLYRDFWDLKQPGIYLFHWFAGSLFGFTETGLHRLELLYMLAFSVLQLVVLRRYLTLQVACPCRADPHGRQLLRTHDRVAPDPAGNTAFRTTVLRARAPHRPGRAVAINPRGCGFGSGGALQVRRRPSCPGPVPRELVHRPARTRRHRDPALARSAAARACRRADRDSRHGILARPPRCATTVRVDPAHLGAARAPGPRYAPAGSHRILHHLVRASVRAAPGAGAVRPGGMAQDWPRSASSCWRWCGSSPAP